MTNSIKHYQPEQEYFFEEGCHIVEISNSSDDEDASIVQATVKPGEQTRWHRLKNTFERYVILSGEGLVQVGDHAPAKVTVKDIVLIPPNTRQRIENTGLEDLTFLAVCTPRFKQENYIDEGA